MKTILIALAMLAGSAWAEPLVVIWDSRTTNAPPATQYRIIDAGRADHPDFRPIYRTSPAPLLWDMADDSFAPFTPGANEDDIESVRTNRLTDAQRAARRVLIAIGTNYGFTARQVRRDPSRVIAAALENSKTNATFNGSRPLIQALGALELMRTP